MPAFAAGMFALNYLAASFFSRVMCSVLVVASSPEIYSTSEIIRRDKQISAQRLVLNAELSFPLKHIFT